MKSDEHDNKAAEHKAEVAAEKKVEAAEQKAEVKHGFEILPDPVMEVPAKAKGKEKVEPLAEPVEGHDVALVKDAPVPAADAFFNEFEAEKVKLTDAAKSWIRKELELFGLGHSAQDRAEMNP